jgi:hypothetical protein
MDETCCFMDGSGTSYGLWMIRMKVVFMDETGFFIDKSCKDPRRRVNFMAISWQEFRI